MTSELEFHNQPNYIPNTDKNRTIQKIIIHDYYYYYNLCSHSSERITEECSITKSIIRKKQHGPQETVAVARKPKRVHVVFDAIKMEKCRGK